MKYFVIINDENYDLSHKLFEEVTLDKVHIFEDIMDIQTLIDCMSHYFLNRCTITDEMLCYVKCFETNTLNTIKIFKKR